MYQGNEDDEHRDDSALSIASVCHSTSAPTHSVTEHRHQAILRVLALGGVCEDEGGVLNTQTHTCNRTDTNHVVNNARFHTTHRIHNNKGHGTA